MVVFKDVCGIRLCQVPDPNEVALCIIYLFIGISVAVNISPFKVIYQCKLTVYLKVCGYIP